MASNGPWVNLAYDDEEMADQASPALMPTMPEHPYGLRICLCGRELEMLGLPLPDKGDMLDCRIMAEVTSVSDGEGGQRVELQIQLIKLIDNEDAEDDDDD
jgi:hypothetical protein